MSRITSSLYELIHRHFRIRGHDIFFHVQKGVFENKNISLIWTQETAILVIFDLSDF